MTDSPPSDATSTTIRKVKRGDHVVQGRDLAAENRAKLAALFPSVLTEAVNEDGQTVPAIDTDALRDLVGAIVEGDAREKFGLSWHGKGAARRLALTPSAGTLRPAPDESVDWDTTKNVMIEGDNLEVLKLLQKSYAGKVKLIYIDPPYNTGNDFVYKDNFRDPLGQYERYTGQRGEEGEALVDPKNREASGRFHTDWLNMIFPRLLLAREMLRQDGVFIASADDAEIARLTCLCDEVFGEENSLAVLVWDRNRKNDARFFSVGHEYMVVYARSKQALVDADVRFRGVKAGVDELREVFNQARHRHGDDWEKIGDAVREFLSSIDAGDDRAPLRRFRKVDVRGPYRDDGNINWPGGGGPTYEVLHPATGKPCKLPVSGWRYPTPERFWEEVEAGRIVFGEDESTVPRVRTDLFTNNDQIMTSVHYSYAQSSTNEFMALFDGDRPFENPKPTKDLAKLTAYLTETDDIILDFFAGSGTTGHATMLQNATDDGQRRYVIVQLPEPTSNPKYTTIAEITKERLRRAGGQVRRDYPEWNGDTGFRVFKLDTANVKAWEAPTTEALEPGQIDDLLAESIDGVKLDRTDDDLLWGAMLNLGLPLDGKVEEHEIADMKVYAAGACTLLACFAQSIGRAGGEALAAGLAGLITQADVEGEVTVLLRDSAFDGDDAVKVNLVENLRQHVPDKATVRVLSI